MKSLFVTQDYNKAGIIVIRGNVLGKPTDIVVDDILPFRINSTSPLFANVSSNGGLWVSFLEKAWAKLNGNYDDINAGGGNEVF